MSPSVLADVIIAGAGGGSRMQAGRNKLLLPLGASTVLEQTVATFHAHPRIARILVTASEVDWSDFEQRLARFAVTLVPGGARRQDSVHEGLAVLAQAPEASPLVLVQDGARPFTSAALISRVLDALETQDAVIPVVPLVDTIRRINASGTRVEDRAELFAVQTPQGARRALLWQASQQAQVEAWEVTDDASLMERAGWKVESVPGERENLKLTLPEDYTFAQWRVQQA